MRKLSRRAEKRAFCILGWWQLRTRKLKAKAGQGTKGRIKGRAKRPAEESGEKGKAISNEPVDMARVRKDISNMVGNSATEIAAGMINAALAGELAPAKYLFEMAGLHPVAEKTEAENPQEDSLAHILLKRMGLPTEPVIQDANSSSSLLPGESKVAAMGKAAVRDREDTVE
jgi:hypothetical protein